MAQGLQGPAAAGSAQFRNILQEWCADHRMFAAALEELAGQLAAVQPQPQPQQQPGASQTAASKLATSASALSAASSLSELLQRVLARAPSERLAAYVCGVRQAPRLQRTLPEQLDQNLRLLGVLAAEMRRFLQQMEALIEATGAALGVRGGKGAEGPSADSAGGRTSHAADDAVLLMAGALEGVTKETVLIERAAAGITLTSPPEEVAAAATVIQLEPFLDSVLLLAALQQEVEEAEVQG